MTSPRTTSSTPRLSEIARHVVAPAGAVSTGWPAVRDRCRDLGISFDPWQDAAGRLILSKRADGKYAATIGGVALSIPRQVGKTFLVGSMVFALCLLHPGLTVIWTAHRLRTAGETFDKMQGMARRRRIRPHIAKVVLGSGEEEVRFQNGSRILFGARERGFGRGFDEVDVLIFDEAQILTENAIDDMVPATNQSRHPAGALMLFMGTPPKPTDPGEVFSRMRADALSGEDQDTGYIEFSADPGFEPTPPPAEMTAEDWRQIAKANPSYPNRTPREAIVRMRKKLTHESMRREGFGVWDELNLSTPFPNWPNCVSHDPPGDRAAPNALGVDMSHDRVISVAACWIDEDAPNETHVELVNVDSLGDEATMVDWLVEWAGRRIPVVIDGQSPAASMIPALKTRKVRLVTTTAGDMGRACGDMYDAVRDGRVWHANQDQLNRAMLGCEKRPIGTAGAWGLDRRDPEVNIAPAVSAVLARYGALTNKKPSAGRTIFA